jgi:NAD(P)-dependent dehydrogenase (short-subunit alcohol dehydrogenase family)
MKVDGSVALVTGANRGLGAAIVDALLATGARRVYAGVRRPLDYTSVSSRVVPIELDVSNATQVQSAAEQCRDVQILINNAGIATAQPLVNATDPGAAELEMRVNYFGTLAMCRAFAPVLATHEGGAIVNILSILSHVNLPRVGSYSASKAATFSLTQALRAELPDTLVIGILPAFVDTDMAKRVSLPKLAPGVVASRIIEALENEIEDVYPGEASTIVERLRAEPKAVERQFARMFPVSATSRGGPSPDEEREPNQHAE